MPQVVKRQYVSRGGEWVEVAGGLDQVTADSLYVSVAGGTITGNLTVSGGTTLNYLVSAYGADMGGFTVTSVADPVNPSDIATKQYLSNRERSWAVEDTALSWNNAIAPGPHPKLMSGTGNPNGPGVGYYFYLTNYLYAGQPEVDPINHTQNMTQFAIGYTGNMLALRNRYSMVWTGWVTFTGAATTLSIDDLAAKVEAMEARVASLEAQLGGQP